MESLINLAILFGMTVLGFACGTIAERLHFKSLVKRETESLPFPSVTFDKGYHPEQVRRAELAMGSVVISLDYFKRIFAALRSIFGGSISAYETLIDRARREAILRMKESHPNADLFVNVRIETSSIGKSANQRKALGSIEALAYGTALFLEKVH